MSDVWLISDEHFYHKNITKYTGRLPDSEEMIVENTNRLVKPEDTLIHLGDVSFNHKKAVDLIKRMDGKHILVMGNHDLAKRTWYEDNGFMFVCNSFTWSISGKYSGPYVLFSHAPIIDLPKDVMYNIHGHHHNSDHRRPEFIAKLNKPSDIHSYILVNIEETLSPIRLQDLIFTHKQKVIQENA